MTQYSEILRHQDITLKLETLKTQGFVLLCDQRASSHCALVTPSERQLHVFFIWVGE